jgi:ribonuclease HI
MVSSVWTAYCDGASRGNPGPASYGVVLCDPNGAVAGEIGECIGINTNQVAEYEALIRALTELVQREAKQVKIVTDSQFVVYQVTGIYRAKDARMKVLLARVKELEPRFEKMELVHIPRSSHPHNKRADALANEALDKAKNQRRTLA